MGGYNSIGMASDTPQVSAVANYCDRFRSLNNDVLSVRIVQLILFASENLHTGQILKSKKYVLKICVQVKLKIAAENELWEEELD